MLQNGDMRIVVLSQRMLKLTDEINMNKCICSCLVVFDESFYASLGFSVTFKKMLLGKKGCLDYAWKVGMVSGIDKRILKCNAQIEKDLHVFQRYCRLPAFRTHIDKSKFGKNQKQKSLDKTFVKSIFICRTFAVKVAVIVLQTIIFGLSTMK